MSAPGATLLLRALSLAGDDGARFEADGALQLDDAAPTEMARFVVGRGATIPATLRARFPEAIDPPADETALWLTVPSHGPPQADEAAWLVVLRPSGAMVHASVPLRADDLELPGLLAFSAGALLSVSVRTAGSRVEQATVTVSGSAALTGALGPATPASLQVTGFELAAEVEGVAALEDILADPTRMLDGAFHGTLAVRAATSSITLGAVVVSGGTAELDLAVRSGAGSRLLELERVAFSLRSPAPLSLLGAAGGLAGLAITDVDLAGTLEGPTRDRVQLTGAGAVTLPDMLGGVLEGGAATAGATLDASFALRTDGADTTLAVDVAGLALAGPAALLGVAEASLGLRLESTAGAWTLSLGTDTRLSWRELERRLAEAGIVALPPHAGPPDVAVQTEVTIASTGAGEVRLGVRSDGLGPMPLEVSDLEIAVRADFDAGGVDDWTVEGSGRLSTAGWLHGVLPLSRVPFTCSASGDGAEMPTMRLVVGAGLPPLALPSFDGGTIELFALTRVELELGETVRVAGTVEFARPRPDLLARELGLPADFADLLGDLAAALPDVGELSINGGEGGAEIEIALRHSAPPTFRLLDALGAIVNPSGRPPPGDVTPLPGLGVPDDFFSVTPGELRLAASLGPEGRVQMGASLDCVVLGESFDLTLGLATIGDDVELSVRAGTTDPIRITVPAPDPQAVLGTANVSAIASAYGLNTNQRLVLQQLHDAFTSLADEVGAQGSLAFEVRDFGLSITADGPTVSGDVRLVQLPRIFELLGPLTRIQLRLGASIEQLFVSISLDAADGPLLTVPLPGDVEVDVFLNRFLLAYAWGRNEFAFELKADVEPSRTLDLTVGGSGIHYPGSETDVQLGVTATAPPVPIPEGSLTFPPEVSRTAVDELGLQAVIGSGHDRFVTAYVRELAFSPTAFLLWPGVRADAGFVAGGPNPAEFRHADDYLEVRDWDRDELFARFTVTRGTLLFIDAFQGVMLNPLAIIPPFVTANPPYWLSPPTSMGDLYADEIGVSLNLPGLVFFDLTFERPLPNFSLQALLELAALAAGGFSRRIPVSSPLYEVFYTRLNVLAELELPGLSEAGTSLELPFEVNVADFINGAIDLMGKARATLDAGSDLLADLHDDPGALVRMVPPQARRFEHEISIGNFELSGSLQLLTPEELEAELKLFFENRRARPRGIAANQAPPDPPARGPINQPANLKDVIVDVRDRLRDTRGKAPPVELLTARAAAQVAGKQTGRAADIMRFKDDHGDQITGVAREAGTRLAQEDAAGRAALLKGLQLGSLVGVVEAAVAGFRPVRGGTTLTQTLTETISAALLSGERFMVASGELPFPPGRIAGDVIAGRPVPAGIIGAVAPVARRVETLRADPDVSVGEREAVRAEVESSVADEFGVRHVSLTNLGGIVAEPRVVEEVLAARALGTWFGRPVTAPETLRTTTFDGGRVADLLGAVGRRPLAPAPVDDVVEAVSGYQIQLRDGDPATFGVAVPLPAATYKVALRGGRYRLLVLDGDGDWSTHDLPAALVASVPEGLGKAAALRDRLVVAPRRIRRNATQAEKAAVAEQEDRSDSLYLTSVLARPEYEIKATGGIHGPLYVADLLRDPATGRYTVPDRPALIAGLEASLFGSEVGLAGMVVASPGAPDLFLHGHHDLRIPLGPLSLKTEGEFTAVSGPLWRGAAVPGGGVAVDGAIGFSGRLEVRRGTTALLAGSARGSFRRASSGTTSGDLAVQVSSQGSVDLEAGEVKFVRVSWSFGGEFEVEIDAGELSLRTDADASVTVAVATYGTRQEEILPAITVCSDVLIVDAWLPIPRGHWESRCITTPAVTVPVPDFSTVQWQSLGTLSCGLHASVSSSGAKLEVDLGPFGQAVSGLIGSTRVELPDLL